MLLSSEEYMHLVDQYDVYDLIEALDLNVQHIIDAFDYLIVENEEIMDKIHD